MVIRTTKNTTLLPHEKSLHQVLGAAQYRLDFTKSCLEPIQKQVQTLERKIDKQKNMKALLKENTSLNEMVVRTTDSEQNTTTSSRKRRREGYDALVEQARKVLKTCKSLKDSEEE